MTLQWMNVELSSVCNLRCKWCILDHKKKPEYLPISLLDSILWQAVKIGTLERIDFHNGGETLLHPEIIQILKILAMRHYREANGWHIKLALLTNGMVLTNEIINLLPSAVDEVRVSVDGGSPEAFEEIRRGANWRTVSSNIEKIKKKCEGTNTKLGIICIVPADKEPIQEWMTPEFRRVLSLADFVDIRNMHHWDGSIAGAEPDKKKPEQVCKFLESNLVVMASGKVSICCADLNGRGIIGDARETPLQDIFNRKSERIAAWRKGTYTYPCNYCEGYL